MADNIGIFDPSGIHPNPLTDLPYSQSFKDLGLVWSKFPAYAKSREILHAINTNQLLFIISSTGSGKTVLVPKLALHYTGYEGKVGITLPKRIVTLSAAIFSAKTLDVTLGEDVGYVYKGSAKNMVGPKNKLLYMTDGTLIMKFVKDPTLSEFKVIIIDEAHERKVQIDLILLFIKNLLEGGQRPDLKVIIMSATIDGAKYQRYFTGISSQIINIGGGTNYEIETHFLEKPTVSYLETGSELIDSLAKNRKDILFFITTSNEALQFCKKVRPTYPKIYCIEVYADMDRSLKTLAESSDLYLELGNYDLKLVMATNVAESSLTIDGLTYVIDSCFELYNYFDPETCGNILEKRFITKAQAMQRRGRVGRTGPGICYHLLTKNQFDSLENYPQPDILKQDITIDMIKIIHLTKTSTYDEGLELLAQLMDPPKKPYVDLAHDLLQMYQIINDNGLLTKIGRDMSQFSSLPMNLSLFLIYSFQLYCAKEASIIIGMIEALRGKMSNIFYKADTMCESGCQKASSKDLMKNLGSKKGDHLTLLNIYRKFKEVPNQKIWAAKYGIRLPVLNEAEKFSNGYFYRILAASRAPPLSRVSEADTKQKILQALELSHRHLLAKNLLTSYPKKQVKGQIAKDSVLYQMRNLSSKSIIYHELTNINNNWEFNLVTIIKN